MVSKSAKECLRLRYGVLLLGLVVVGLADPAEAITITLTNHTGTTLIPYPVVTTPPPPHRERDAANAISDNGSHLIDEAGFNPVFFNDDLTSPTTVANGFYVALDLESDPPMIQVKVFHYKIEPGKAEHDPDLQPVLISSDVHELIAGQNVCIIAGPNFSMSVTQGDMPPTAICQNVTKPETGCQATVTPAEVDNGSFDPDCGTVTLSLAPPGPYSLGATAVTLTATDEESNTGTCTATINVADTTPPTANCPPINMVETTTDPGGKVMTYTATASDGCDPSPSMVCTPASGSTFPIGDTTVNCTATDASANTDTCSFGVKIILMGGPPPPEPPPPCGEGMILIGLLALPASWRFVARGRRRRSSGGA